MQTDAGHLRTLHRRCTGMSRLVLEEGYYCVDDDGEAVKGYKMSLDDAEVGCLPV